MRRRLHRWPAACGVVVRLLADPGRSYCEVRDAGRFSDGLEIRQAEGRTLTRVAFRRMSVPASVSRER
ncbi:MAG: hypothetical protein KY443_04960 [Actinobacteria bacterium]|nr:hypothetical protein [Actinomycetota bacterium]